jgi:ubiquinone/menaquinone biosynthesis C-methylase UbiE
MATGAAVKIPVPERIMQIIGGYQPLYTLASALDLRVFNHIAEGHTTEPALAAATGASRRGLSMLLDVLVSLGLLSRDGKSNTARYELTPESEMYLIAGRPGYLGKYVQISAAHIAKQWQHLTDSVLTGKPGVALDDPEEGAQFWHDLVEALFPWNYPLASFVGRHLAQMYPNAPRLLDVAAGAGVWGIAAAQANPTLRVTAVDLPQVLPYAQQNAQRFGLSERFEFRPGNIREIDFGASEYDIAILGQICHSEGPEHSRELFRRVYRALKPGGNIVVMDMVPNEERTAPLFSLTYALTMLVSTTDGGTFTYSEYESWLQEAGFQNILLLEAMGQTFIAATRVE